MEWRRGSNCRAPALQTQRLEFRSQSLSLCLSHTHTDTHTHTHTHSNEALEAVIFFPCLVLSLHHMVHVLVLFSSNHSLSFPSCPRLFSLCCYHCFFSFTAFLCCFLVFWHRLSLVDQAGLKHMVLFLQPPKCGDYRPVQLLLASFIRFSFLKVLGF
jgi:hypothetical protein